MLIACKEKGEIDKLTQALKSEFEMKTIGTAKRILGIDINKDRKRGTLTWSQSGYLKKMINIFDMKGCKPVSTPIPPHFKLHAVKENLPKEEADYM